MSMDRGTRNRLEDFPIDVPGRAQILLFEACVAW